MKTKLNADDRFFRNIPEPFLKIKEEDKKAPIEIVYHMYGQSVRAI